MEDERIVAFGLLTQYDLSVLGAGFRRAYPLDTTTDFDGLLQKIDAAEQALRPQIRIIE